jgi:branched-chain amino acid aminotransferase
MILARWTSAYGWEAPILKPSGPLEIPPTASVLHYAIECFEGLKLYRGYDGGLRLFRPAKNCERMRTSAARVTLPDFDPKELGKMIIALCAQDGPRWLPKEHVGEFLYIRPTLISTDPALGVRTPKEALLYVVLACFGNNFFIVPAAISDIDRSAQDLPGLKLRTSDLDSIRAWPGGFGYAKIGANYGPSLVAQRETQAAGYDQTLWLFGDKGIVTEAGGSNFFVVWRNGETGRLELVTAPLQDGIILAGITRASILELAQSRLGETCDDLEAIDVVERQYTIDDISRAFHGGRLLEAFVCGTTFFVTPVSVIKHRGETIELEQGCYRNGYARKMRSWLAEVMWENDRHGDWVVDVKEAS